MAMLRVGDAFEGYELVGELPGGKSRVARDGSGRTVVVKRLGDDCLLGEKLHPSIRQRLERVRELAVKQVANLHGVRLDRGAMYLVWDYVHGKRFDEAVRQRGDGARLGREVMLAVQSMHAAGIVHGAIHEGNVIVDERGKVWLIDVSPLLWSDEREDLQAAEEMLGRNGVVKERMGRETENEESAARWISLALAGGALAAGVGVAAMVWAMN